MLRKARSFDSLFHKEPYCFVRLIVRVEDRACKHKISGDCG